MKRLSFPMSQLFSLEIFYLCCLNSVLNTTLVLILKGLGEMSDSLNMISQSSLFVYPNPVNDVLNLRCVGEIFRIDIFDMLGNHQIALTSNTSNVNVSQLSKGSYLIYVKSKNENSIVEYKTKFLKL